MAIGQWQSGRLWLCSRGFDSPWSPHGWVCPAARAADCKSVTKKHRRFESCPIHFCLRVRAVYGATLLRWCAATHRRFESFRKRTGAGADPAFLCKGSHCFVSNLGFWFSHHLAAILYIYFGFHPNSNKYICHF